eukprot:jgi/Botrbrau1/6617/Bobra.104_2s0005.1
MMRFREPTDWATLLDDVFESVLAQLDSTAIPNVRLTCKAWKSKTGLLLQGLSTWHADICRLVQIFPGLAHLELRPRICHLRELAELGRLRRLRSFTFDARKLGSVQDLCLQDFTLLVNCSNLVRLSLAGIHFSSALGLQGLPHLQCLRLQGCTFLGADFTDLTWLLKLPRLTALEVSGSMHSSPRSFEGIGLLTQLSSVSLAGSKGMSDVLCAELANLHQLTSLDLGRNPTESRYPSISNAGAFHLARLTQLRVLSLAGQSAVSDVGVVALCQSLHALESLDLFRPPGPGPHGPAAAAITDASFLAIAKLPKLERLRVSEAQVESKGCAALSGMPALRCLHLSHCPFLTDAAACKLSSLTGLIELHLDRCSSLTNIGVASLARGLTNLRVLDLSGCHLYVSDIGVKALACCSTKLEVLRLAYCDRIGSSGVQALGILSSLKQLDLSNCAGVTDQSLQALCASLHRLEYLNIEYCQNLTSAVLPALAKMPALQDLRFSGSSLPADLELCPGVRWLPMVQQKHLWWML